MAEQNEKDTQELTKGMEKKAVTNPQSFVSTTEQTQEGDGEQQSYREEKAVDKSTDKFETVEEAEIRAEDAERLQSEENVGTSTATVKVVLVPEGKVMTEAFAIGLSIQELKRHLALKLKVPLGVLQFTLEGRVLEDQQSLMELGVQPNGSTQMELSSTDPANHQLRTLPALVHDNMPDVITVRVQTDEGMFKEVVVEIEHCPQQKSFLGGYRHKMTGTEYHHAAIQTLPKRRPDRGVVVFCRDTQTVDQKTKAQQCPADVSTQMTGIGCYMSCLVDRLVSPRIYITADELHDRRLRAAIRLQSYARRWLAQQKVDQLKRQRDLRIAWVEARKRRWMEEKEMELRDRHQRWMNPQKKEDLNLQYQALEKWRCQEEERINSALRGAERKAALCSLMEQQMQFIADIGCHRGTLQNNNHSKHVKNFLDKSSAPHQWHGADGRLIELDNPNTIRARELRDLYNDVNMSTTSPEQRLHILMKLKQIVKEHECQLTLDLVDLIDREVDLMTRVKTVSLEGLRKRISTLFLQLIKTPAFNPEVAKLLMVPQNTSKLKNQLFLCRGCHRYLYSANFSSSNDTNSRCHSCFELKNIAISRTDFSSFKNILRRLRAEEQRLNEESMIPFLMQVEDIRHLVEETWASRSALHGTSDIYNLVFVRWDPQKFWSPWNCILLSKEEASAHMEVEDVNQVYEKMFISSIKHKHKVARRHFSQIFVMAENLNSAMPAVSLGNQNVSMPISMATGKSNADTPPIAH